MAGQLEGRTVAILAANGVEEVELIEPRDAVRKAGGRIDVLSVESGEIQAMNQDVEKAAGSRWTGGCPRQRSRTTTRCCCPVVPPILITCGKIWTRCVSSATSSRRASRWA